MTEDNNSTAKAILEFGIRTIVNLTLLFLLVQSFVVSHRFAYQLFADLPYVPASNQVYNITIAEGTSPRELAGVLAANQIVESDMLFLARVYIGKYGTRIQAGTYSLGPGMSPDEICKKICGVTSGGAP